MDDPVYRRFTVSSKIEDCLQVPPDPAKDACKVQVEEATTASTFTLERKGSQYQPAAADAGKVQKTLPGYSAPVQELLDYLHIKGVFHKNFGTFENPTEIAKQITVVTTKSGIEPGAMYIFLESLANFISHGQLKPSHPKMKAFLEDSIRYSVNLFADPTLGALGEKMLRDMKKSSTLGAESQKRLDWVLGLYELREKFWGELKPELDKSTSLSNSLKASSRELMVFMLAGHILAESGYKDKIFSQDIRDLAKTFNSIHTNLDPHFHPANNVYSYLSSIFTGLRSVNIPAEFRKDFEQRLDVLISEYQKEGKAEMFRLMDQAPMDKSCKDYLLYLYGDTPARREALQIILKQTIVLGEEDGPRFLVEMVKINPALQQWVDGQPTPEKKKEALEAVNHLLKSLFERGGKMTVYWNKQVKEIDNFYTRGDFPLVGSNKTALEKLIRWARGEAVDAQIDLPPDSQPRYPMRKYTLITELGVGAAGVGTFFGLGALKENETSYFARGGTLIAGGIGLGMAAGNALSYLLAKNGGSFWWDVGGGILGGALAGILYFSTAKKPPNNPYGIECIGNCTKFPTDEYGKSFHFSFGKGF